ncbi:MAG: hypothetical protein ABI448_16775, partial [Bacteroidia bacterium]
PISDKYLSSDALSLLVIDLVIFSCLISYIILVKLMSKIINESLKGYIYWHKGTKKKLIFKIYSKRNQFNLYLGWFSHILNF